MQKHVLLVDDDEDELEIFMAALNELNSPIKCTYARSGEQAIKMLHYLTPDYIFLDFNMPKIDGLSCLQELSKLEHGRFIPVVLYSNHITKETNEAARSLGAVACIMKPAKITTLTKILNDILERDQACFGTSQQGNC